MSKYDNLTTEDANEILKMMSASTDDFISYKNMSFENDWYTQKDLEDLINELDPRQSTMELE